MVITAAELRKDVNQILKNGEVVRFQYFTVSGAAANYDDDATRTKSGIDVFTSGLVQPIRGAEGSNEANLIQQGRLKTDDLRLYIAGDIDTSGTFIVGLGSPTFQNYSKAEDGVESWTLGGGGVYKKVFIRFLPNGSLIGEV